MCVRYVGFDAKAERMKIRLATLALEFESFKAHDRWPGYDASFHDGEALVKARWGLMPHWAKEASYGARHCYNARIEGSEHPKPGQKPGIEHMSSYRDAWKKRRCVIPMSSYYETPDVEEAIKAKRYVRIFPTEAPLFLMAGSWEEPNDLSTLPTFTIVTTASNGELAEIHSRRLARLDEDAVATWLDLDAPIDLLKEIVQPRDDEPIRLEEAERPRRPSKKKSAEPTLI